METTSNLNIQKKNYAEVEPHDNRVQSKTKNHNIMWSIKYGDKTFHIQDYEILSQRPQSYHKLMQKQWGQWVRHHDLVQRRNRHYKTQYKSVKNFLLSRNSKAYRTVVIGFGNGELRKRVHRQIHKAYPQARLVDVLKAEGRAMNQVPKSYNSDFLTMPLTDFAVHTSELRNHCGQLHLQGRIALLGTTKGRRTTESKTLPNGTTIYYQKRHPKPSMSLNRAVKQAVEPHMKEYQDLYQRVHEKKPKKLRNSRQYLSAFRLLADYKTFHIVSKSLERQFPKAHLNFQFARTSAVSVSHEKWQRQQDDQHALRDDIRASVNSATASATVSEAMRSSKVASSALTKTAEEAHAINQSVGVDDLTKLSGSGSSAIVLQNNNHVLRTLAECTLPQMSDQAERTHKQNMKNNVAEASINDDRSSVATASALISEDKASIATARATTSNDLEEASRVSSSADELVPKYRHHYSASASDEVASASASLSASAEASVSSASTSVISTVDDVNSARSVNESQISEINKNYKIQTGNAKVLERLSSKVASQSSSAVEASKSVSTASSTVASESASLFEKNHRANSVAHSINRQFGVDDIDNHSLDEQLHADPFNNSLPKSPLEELLKHGLPKIEHAVTRISRFKSHFKEWIEKRAKHAWASMPTFMKDVHQTEKNVDNQLNNDDDYKNVNSSPHSSGNTVKSSSSSSSDPYAYNPNLDPNNDNGFEP